MTLAEFIDMGGYGAFVWSAYAVCFIVLIANVVQPIWRERQTLRELEKRQRAREKQPS